MIVRARTPLRISYAGGGTDVDPFKDKYGGVVLNSAISKYCHGTLKTRDDESIGIHSIDLGISIVHEPGKSILYDGNLDLIKAVIRHIQNKASSKIGGFDIQTYCEAPPGSGLGTSSAVVVTIIGLLCRAYGIHMDSYDTAKMAWIIERRDMEMAGGFQDQFTAVFGGKLNYMEFRDGFDVVVNKLDVDRSVLNEFQSRLSMYFTGGLHKSHDIIKDQIKDEESKNHHLLEMKLMASHMKDCIMKGRLGSFGDLLLHEWQIKKRLSSMITNKAINEMEEVALEAGADGLKITGAGGGGMMLVASDPMKKLGIAKALGSLGAVPVDFEFVKPGLETWVVNEG